MDNYLKMAICLLCALSIQVRADFSDAVKLYNDKKFPDAMQEFQRVAALGYKPAQLNIGVMYFRGEGVEKNIIEAYAWTALSAEDDHAESIRTKDIIFSKMDDQQKIAADIKLKELMSLFGNQTLRTNLYPKYSQEKSKLIQARFKAMPDLPSSSVSEVLAKFEMEYDIDSQGYIHNYVFLEAEGVKDPQKLADYLAGLKNYPKRLGEISTPVYNYKFTQIRGGNGREKQFKDEVNEEMREGLTDDIDWSNSESLYRHAQYYSDSPLSVKTQQHKTLLFLSAAKMGHAKAQTAIALKIIYGENFEQDRQKALKWLLAVDNSKDASSLYHAASLLYDGILVDKNKAKAIDFFQQAVNQQHPKSKVKLAWILATEKEESFSDPQKALQLITEVYDKYLDRVTAYETLAVAQAANGQFENAIKSQKSALNFAKKIGIEADAVQRRLTSYEQRTAWKQ